MILSRHIWAAAAAVLLAVPAMAQSTWIEIGSREVSNRVDRDVIEARGRDVHRQIRLCVEKAPVRFYEVVVRYRNGASQDLPVRELVGRGYCTRTYDLRGRERNIESVAFTYEAASLRRSSARVRLYAL